MYVCVGESSLLSTPNANALCLFSFFLSFFGSENPINHLGQSKTVLDRCPPTYGDGPAGVK